MFKVILGIIIIAALLIYFTGNYFYNYAIARRKKIEIKVFSELHNGDPAEAERAKVAQWVQETPMEERRISAFDGVSLYGQIGHSAEKSQKWVICVHGYGCTGRSMYKFAKRFYEVGFNFILPDCRGHGNSGGRYVGMGWHDRLDVMKWIDEVLKEDKDAEILLFGVSMGAAAVMMTAGEKLPKNVRCIVEDCGYTSARDTFAAVYDREFPKLRIFNIAFAVANIVCRKKANYDLMQASALAQVQKAQVPMLFIHGTADNFVPFQMVYQLYDAAKCKKDIMLVEGAGHIKSSEIGKETYWNKLFAFVNEFV